MNHRPRILASTLCGCFYCRKFFEPREIEDWTDFDDKGVGMTALCPRCGIDSVLRSISGFPLTESFLGQMNNRWFGKRRPDKQSNKTR
jgi:hypothetical protein